MGLISTGKNCVNIYFCCMPLKYQMVSDLLFRSQYLWKIYFCWWRCFCAIANVSKINYFIITIGRGNMIVKFFSAEIWVKVCRYLRGSSRLRNHSKYLLKSQNISKYLVKSQNILRNLEISCEISRYFNINCEIPYSQKSHN